MNQENKNKKKSSSLISKAIIGFIIIFYAFFLLYRGERVKNKAWHVKKTEKINPEKTVKRTGMVKFTGFAQGDLIKDIVSGEQFIYLEKNHYRFEKVKKIKTEFMTKDGETKTAKKTVYKNEWVLQSSSEQLTDIIKIGKIKIRMNEAKLIGDDEWEKKIYMNNKKDKPNIGDERYDLEGINAKQPLFVVGHLSDNLLGSGKIFIVSAFSEEKTLKKISKSRWFRKLFCFIILLIGFALLYHPFIEILKYYQQYPACKALSQMGCSAYVLIGLILSYLIVKYAYIIADFLWIFVLGIIAIPAISIYQKNRLK